MYKADPGTGRDVPVERPSTGERHIPTEGTGLHSHCSAALLVFSPNSDSNIPTNPKSRDCNRFKRQRWQARACVRTQWLTVGDCMISVKSGHIKSEITAKPLTKYLALSEQINKG